jgi:hypothetical protein
VCGFLFVAGVLEPFVGKVNKKKSWHAPPKIRQVEPTGSVVRLRVHLTNAHYLQMSLAKLPVRMFDTYANKPHGTLADGRK